MFIKPSKLKHWRNTLAAFSPFPLPTRPQQTVWVKRMFSTQCKVTIYYIVKCVMLTIKFHQHKTGMKLRFETNVYCICKYSGMGLKVSSQDMYWCVTGQSSEERSPRRCIWSWTCSRRTAACLCICRTSPVCGAAWGQRGVVLLRRNNVLCCTSRRKRGSGLVMTHQRFVHFTKASLKKNKKKKRAYMTCDVFNTVWVKLLLAFPTVLFEVNLQHNTFQWGQV